MSLPPPPRRPWSPWSVGAVVLGVFVALSIILRGTYDALRFMFIAVIVIALAATWNRAKTRPVATPDPPAVKQPTAPQQVAQAGSPKTHLPPVAKAAAVAAHLGITENEVITEIQAGRMPGNRVGAHWLIRKEALDAFLDGAYAANRSN